MTSFHKQTDKFPQDDPRQQAPIKKEPEESPLAKILTRISQNHDFPSVSKYLIEINQKLSTDTDGENASDLANVILKDYALTNKLLKLVNSAFYGLAAGKVTTVTRAVVVLGFENIRMATLSLVLFEHFKTKSNISELKEVVISSFWAGVLARDIAKMSDNVDAEEALVCAMMNQLGKLLIIYYYPEKYRKIVDRMILHGENETKATKTACGFTYDELGMAVARQWNFPPQICNSMPILKTSELKNKKKPPAKLWALSSFVKELAANIRDTDPVAQKTEFENLIDRYQIHIKVTKRQLKTLLEESLKKVNKHAAAMNFNAAQSSFLNSLANYSQLGSKNQTAEGTDQGKNVNSFQLTDLEEIKANAQYQTERSAKDTIMEGIQEISEAMMAELDVNDVALMSLEVLYRALKFQRALMFVRKGSGQTISVRYGYGHSVQSMIHKVEFKPKADQDLFSLCIKEGKDLIVADSYDPKLNELMPPWYRKHINAPAFIFLPVIFKNICIGAFYADRNKDGIPISEEEHRYIGMLRNQLILAIKYR